MSPNTSIRVASTTPLRSSARVLLTATALSIAVGIGAKSHAAAMAEMMAVPSTQPWNLLGNQTLAEVGRVRDARLTELSDEEYFSYSGVGAIVCTINGQKQTSTAFLVGSFDLAVTVAHTFVAGTIHADPSDCIYTSTDSTGQIRERIPVEYYKSEWLEANAVGQPAKDLAVVRLAQRSAFAHRTLPLGKFSGAAAPVTMIGFSREIDTDTFKHKSTGTVYGRETSKRRVRVADVADVYTHDLDAHGLAPGAPVLDARSGVIIGVHTTLPPALQATAEHTPVSTSASPRNALIVMNSWLERTLRAEIPLRAADNNP